MGYDERQVIEEQVTDEEGIVYDVSVMVTGQQIEVEAQYNGDASAENFETVEDVHGTGPAMDDYHDTIFVVGTPPTPEDIRDNLAEYFEHIEQAYWNDA